MHWFTLHAPALHAQVYHKSQYTGLTALAVARNNSKNSTTHSHTEIVSMLEEAATARCAVLVYVLTTHSCVHCIDYYCVARGYVRFDAQVVTCAMHQAAGTIR